MSSTAGVWQDITGTLAPRRESQEGILPPLMILLTIVTGIVDAVAYLRLGHVFVANMTGNVVFLGFAAAGASGLSVAGSLLALACFLPGGIAAGRLAARFGDNRLRQLRVATTVQLVLCGAAVIVAAAAGKDFGQRRSLRLDRATRAGDGDPERDRPPPRRQGPHDHRSHADPHRHRFRLPARRRQRSEDAASHPLGSGDAAWRDPGCRPPAQRSRRSHPSHSPP